MRTAEDWKDYELIDTSSGNRLERWGRYILVRPDPQVIWKSEKNDPLWNNADAVYHRSSAGGGSWEYIRRLPEEWTIEWNGLKMYVTPTNFKHTGVFPEQAANWDWFSQLIAKEVEKRGKAAIGKDASNPVKVLNLFAYTGGATVSAAAAGAHVTHVDASKGMVNWAKENAVSSGLGDAPIRWLVDDCKKFVEREIRRGNHYDAIIMDPPSYGRGPKGEIWKIEDTIHDLVKACASILSDDPLFFLINSYTTGLAPSVLSYLLGLEIQPRFGGTVLADEIGLPVKDTGLVLPCGSSGRWEL
jgi:23S rRNA (cytosine1962-C5)-methyltransferase